MVTGGSGARELPASFDAAPGPRLVFGAGALGRLGELVHELGARRALLVTDPGIVAAGHAARAESSLRGAGVEVARHDDVRAEPTTDDVERCARAARAAEPELFVGLGGGSAIDVAKGAAFLLAGGGRMEDYHGKGRARGRLLPIVAVPTTAGTGTEVQSFALIADPHTHRKMACGDPQALPRAALLDPELTRTQPRPVAALAGLDALGHAVETWVTRARNPLSAVWSREAFRRAARALPRVLADGADLAARAEMQLAATFAGLAIERSMLGAAHSMANPLSSRFGFAHGHAVGVALPAVVRFNAVDAATARRYGELAAAAGLAPTAEALAARIEELLDLAGVPRSLRDAGVPADAAGPLADEALEQWTARFNPRPVAREDFRTLYERLG